MNYIQSRLTPEQYFIFKKRFIKYSVLPTLVTIGLAIIDWNAGSRPGRSPLEIFNIVRYLIIILIPFLFSMSIYLWLQIQINRWYIFTFKLIAVLAFMLIAQFGLSSFLKSCQSWECFTQQINIIILFCYFIIAITLTAVINWYKRGKQAV